MNAELQKLCIFYSDSEIFPIDKEKKRGARDYSCGIDKK